MEIKSKTDALNYVRDNWVFDEKHYPEIKFFKDNEKAKQNFCYRIILVRLLSQISYLKTTEATCGHDVRSIFSNKQPITTDDFPDIDSSYKESVFVILACMLKVESLLNCKVPTTVPYDDLILESFEFMQKKDWHTFSFIFLPPYAFLIKECFRIDRGFDLNKESIAESLHQAYFLIPRFFKKINMKTPWYMIVNAMERIKKVPR